jgi:hypothetical protein
VRNDSLADKHLQTIRKLCEPSVIALVSVSEAFLRTARGLLAPTLEGRHTLLEVLWPGNGARDLGAADLVLCDSITFEKVQHPRRILYRLIVPSSMAYIVSAMNSYFESSKAVTY